MARSFVRKYCTRIVSLSAALLFSSFVFLAPSASADSFSLSDGTNLITFSVPASPVASYPVAGVDFEIDNVAVLVNGSSETESLFFFNASQLGGFGIGDMTSTLVNQQGPQLYTGTEDMPTFSPGMYSLTNLALFNGGNAVFSNDFTLTISSSSQPVPEPSSALLLGMGLMGLVGAGIARKKAIS